MSPVIRKNIFRMIVEQLLQMLVVRKMIDLFRSQIHMIIITFQPSFRIMKLINRSFNVFQCWFIRIIFHISRKRITHHLIRIGRIVSRLFKMIEHFFQRILNCANIIRANFFRNLGRLQELGNCWSLIRCSNCIARGLQKLPPCYRSLHQCLSGLGNQVRTFCRGWAAGRRAIGEGSVVFRRCRSWRRRNHGCWEVCLPRREKARECCALRWVFQLAAFAFPNPNELHRLREMNDIVFHCG